jgi:peptidoglycan/LPS O-acetylase OafA/YrhL
MLSSSKCAIRHQPLPHPNYRPDIDGLRAVAVSAVVFNHMGIQQWSGGFFGVDIFFVISGYLISGLIVTRLKEDRFSILDFYRRRCRRILPALVVMMVGILPFAYNSFLPPELEDFSKTLISAALGLSNFYFFKHSGYFDAESAASPLLHTWSLGVEEQFYFLFPALSIIIYRLAPARLFSGYVLLFFISLACCVLTVFNNHPAAAFYLLPSRAWELALGAIISFERLPSITNPRIRTAAALFGAVLIATSFFAMSARTPYLGIAAIVPCLGCALLIVANKSGGSVVATALSAKAPTFIGRISYSLYLWHWPILVFSRLRLQSPFDALDEGLMIAATLLAATVSWKFVETPFRKATFPQRSIFRLSFAAITSVLVIAFYAYISDGLRNRFPKDVADLASFMHYDARSQSREGRCFVTDSMTYDRSYCLSRDSYRQNFLVVGDSHAAHLWYGLSKVFQTINFMQATASSCPPTMAHQQSISGRCRELTDFIFGDFLLHEPVDGVVLYAAWDNYDISQLPQAIDIAKKNARLVILLGPMVQYDQGLPKILANALLSGNPDLPFSHRKMENLDIDRRMAELAAQKSIGYISFFQLLCDANSCETVNSDGTPLLYDYGHLTSEGAIKVARKMRELKIFTN